MTQTQDEQNVQASAASTPDLSAIDLSTESANPVETSIPEDPVAPAESSSNNEDQGFQIDGLDSDSIPDSPDPTPAVEQPAPAAEQPAPAAEQPAPTTEQPAPAVEQPAPTAEQPAPTAEQPAPAEENKTSFLEDSKNKVSEGVST